MIPTLEKNHPQTVGADSIATYGLGSESTCVQPPPLRHDRSPIPESWTFSDAADRRKQFHQWTQRQQVGRSSRIALRLLPIDSPTMRSKPSALSTRLSNQGEKFPELSTVLKRLHSRRSPCRRSDFRRSDPGSVLVSNALWRRS